MRSRPTVVSSTRIAIVGDAGARRAAARNAFALQIDERDPVAGVERFRWRPGRSAPVVAARRWAGRKVRQARATRRPRRRIARTAVTEAQFLRRRVHGDAAEHLRVTPQKIPIAAFAIFRREPGRELLGMLQCQRIEIGRKAPRERVLLPDGVAEQARDADAGAEQEQAVPQTHGSTRHGISSRLCHCRRRPPVSCNPTS